jgi:hypothetical protein
VPSAQSVYGTALHIRRKFNYLSCGNYGALSVTPPVGIRGDHIRFVSNRGHNWATQYDSCPTEATIGLRHTVRVQEAKTGRRNTIRVQQRPRLGHVIQFVFKRPTLLRVQHRQQLGDAIQFVSNRGNNWARQYNSCPTKATIGPRHRGNNWATQYNSCPTEATIQPRHTVRVQQRQQFGHAIQFVSNRGHNIITTGLGNLRPTMRDEEDCGGGL